MKRELNKNREDLLSRDRTDRQSMLGRRKEMLRRFMLEATEKLDNQMILNYCNHVVAYYGDCIEEKDMKY